MTKARRDPLTKGQMNRIIDVLVHPYATGADKAKVIAFDSMMHAIIERDLAASAEVHEIQRPPLGSGAVGGCGWWTRKQEEEWRTQTKEKQQEEGPLTSLDTKQLCRCSIHLAQNRPPDQLLQVLVYCIKNYIVVIGIMLSRRYLTR
jgi:hypothetical protein